MNKGTDGKGLPRVIRLSELRKGPVRGISDLAERNGLQGSTIRPLGAKFIDAHGLVSGLYNVYINPVKEPGFRCEVPDCRDILQEYYLRIMAAMDEDGDWYTLASMAREPAVYEALLNTNRKVIFCLEHKATAVIVAGEQRIISPGPMIPIGEARKKRARDWKKRV